MKPVQYKDFTIEIDFRNPYSDKPNFMFYRASEGIQHDADCKDGESFTYTGNCRWAYSIAEAQDQIDEWEEQNADDLRIYELERKADS